MHTCLSVGPCRIKSTGLEAWVTPQQHESALPPWLSFFLGFLKRTKAGELSANPERGQGCVLDASNHASVAAFAATPTASDAATSPCPCGPLQPFPVADDCAHATRVARPSRAAGCYACAAGRRPQTQPAPRRWTRPCPWTAARPCQRPNRAAGRVRPVAAGGQALPPVPDGWRRPCTGCSSTDTHCPPRNSPAAAVRADTGS